MENETDVRVGRLSDQRRLSKYRIPRANVVVIRRLEPWEMAPWQP